MAERDLFVVGLDDLDDADLARDRLGRAAPPAVVGEPRGDVVRHRRLDRRGRALGDVVLNALDLGEAVVRRAVHVEGDKDEHRNLHTVVGGVDEEHVVRRDVDACAVPLPPGPLRRWVGVDAPPTSRVGAEEVGAPHAGGLGLVGETCGRGLVPVDLPAALVAELDAEGEHGSEGPLDDLVDRTEEDVAAGGERGEGVVSRVWPRALVWGGAVIGLTLHAFVVAGG